MRLELLAIDHGYAVEQVRFQTACNFKSLKYIAVYRRAAFRAASNPEIRIRFLESLRFLVPPDRQKCR